MNTEFIRRLDRLKGAKCWGVIAGKGTGSAFQLFFGKKYRRLKLFPNPLLSDDVRRYDPQFSIFVQCSWRMDSKTRVICSSTDPDDNDGEMVRGLDLLLNKTLENIIVSFPGYDTCLMFSESLFIKIFCDEILKGATNYSLKFRDIIYYIDGGGLIGREKY